MTNDPTAAFDPYHKWLGIPPSEQPANHYRLLGITLFESDPDVITIAADRQMAHLKSFASGRYSAHSQKLLAELSKARLALLNSASKRAYDDRLRAVQAKAGTDGHRNEAATGTQDVRSGPGISATEGGNHVTVHAESDTGYSVALNREPVQDGLDSPQAGPAISVAADWATQRLANRNETRRGSRWLVALLLLAFALIAPVGSYLLLRNAAPGDGDPQSQEQQQLVEQNPQPHPPDNSKQTLQPGDVARKASHSTLAQRTDRETPEPRENSDKPLGAQRSNPPPGGEVGGEDDQPNNVAVDSRSFQLDLSRSVMVIELGNDLPRGTLVAVQEIKNLDAMHVMSDAKGFVRENHPLDIELTEFNAVFRKVVIRLSLKRHGEALQLCATGQIDAGLKAPFSLTNEGRQRLYRLLVKESTRLAKQLAVAQSRGAQIEAVFSSRRMLPIPTRRAMVREHSLLKQRIPALQGSYTMARQRAAAVEQLGRVVEAINGRSEIAYRLSVPTELHRQPTAPTGRPAAPAEELPPIERPMPDDAGIDKRPAAVPGRRPTA